MRQQIETVVKKKLRELVIKERHRQDMVQEEMAGALVMSPRSYADIERGAGSCGMLTVLLLLMSMEDPESFLEDLRQEIETTVKKGGMSA